MKKKLYNLLYEWFVSEVDCSQCKHMGTFVEGDKRHPCNRCDDYYDRFKVSEEMKEDLKEKVVQIMEIIKKKEK